jgi:DNA polymerase III epsilon subunit-like protein
MTLKQPLLKLEPVADDTYAVSDLHLPNFSQMRLWLFDLEGTGLDTSVERVTQIAGVPLQGGEILEDESFSEYVNPGIDIPQMIQELTGITPEKVADAPPFSTSWPTGLAAAAGSDLWIGQSVFEYDVPLLDAELARHAMPPALPPILDSVVIATLLLGEPDGRWSTSALLKRFDVNIEGLRRHDALDDVIILGRTMLPMLEMLKRDHDDCIHIGADEPLAIKRHPPIKSEK